MQAVLSGRAAVALLTDGKAWHSLHYDDLDRLVPRDAADFAQLFHESRDLEWLEQTTLDEVRDRLEDAVDSTEGLDLVLYLFDPQFSDETRETAALELEALVVDPEIVSQIENVFLATPLPEAADSAGALVACRRTGSVATQAVLAEWIALQPVVRDVCLAWSAISEARFADEDDRHRVQGQLIRHGVFRQMTRQCGETGGAAQVQLQTAQDAELRNAVPGLVGIMNDWTQPFRSIRRGPNDAEQHENSELDAEDRRPQGFHQVRGFGRHPNEHA